MFPSKALLALFGFLFGSFSTLLLRSADVHLRSSFLNSTEKACIENCDSATGNTSTKSDNRSRLICWIMSRPEATDKREAIVETWGKKCDLLLFMLSVESRPQTESSFRVPVAPHAHLVYLNMTKSDIYQNLWEKTRLALTYVHETYGDEYDWILKADDNTFVIVENLRTFLKDKNPENRTYYGCNRMEFAENGYNDGGAGYVMSRINVRRFVNLLNENGGDCIPIGHDAEDVRLAQCLSLIDIFPVDTQDERARLRFTQYNPKQLLSPDLATADTMRNDRLREVSRRKFGLGADCCSESAVSFHAVTPQEMRLFQYLIHDLHVTNEKN